MTLLSSFPCRNWRRAPKSSSRCYMTSAAFGSISGHASKRHFQEALSRNIHRCFGMGTSALPKKQNPSSFGSWICPRKNFKPWVSRVSRETRQTFPFEFFHGQIHRPKRNHIAKMRPTANLWWVFPETRRHFQNMGKPITLATWISIFSHDWFLPTPRFCDGFSQKPVTFWSWNWAPRVWFVLREILIFSLPIKIWHQFCWPIPGLLIPIWLRLCVQPKSSALTGCLLCWRQGLFWDYLNTEKWKLLVK